MADSNIEKLLLGTILEIYMNVSLGMHMGGSMGKQGYN